MGGLSHCHPKLYGSNCNMFTINYGDPQLEAIAHVSLVPDGSFIVNFTKKKKVINTRASLSITCPNKFHNTWRVSTLLTNQYAYKITEI